MVFFNYATMQMAAKIVYYGPGLCGKTTNLHVIYGRTAPNSRGEMVSLETETDRTLFFDLLPLDVGVIGGFKTRLQLYTVPGQVFYNTTRKLVLKGVDGIVFVADSQRPMLDPNRESYKNLKDNLAEIGVSLADVPLVFQFNKRDLSNILTVDELNDALNAGRAVEWHEASAANGVGVFETLKGISKLTLKSLRSRMTGDLKRPAVVATPTTPAAVSPVAPAPAAAQKPAPPPTPPPPSRPAPPPTPEPRPTMDRLERFSEIAGLAASRPVETAPFATAEPLAEPPPLPPADLPFPEPVPVAAKIPRVEEEVPSDINFGESDRPVAAAAAEAPLKHVRVRSSVDILAELDKLRKVATQRPTGLTGAFPALTIPPRAEAAPAAGKSSPGLSIQDLLGAGPNHKRSVTRSFDVGVPREAMSRSRRVSVALTLLDSAGDPSMPERTFVVELTEARELEKLLLSLKVNVQND